MPSATIWTENWCFSKKVGGRLIDYRASIRPTRKRLLTAMGVSTVAVALLLVLPETFFEFAVNNPPPNTEFSDPLTVRIRTDEVETATGTVTSSESHSSPTQQQGDSSELAEDSPVVASDDSIELPAESPPLNDWRELSGVAAKASIAEYFREEETRHAMWRRSYSVMFEPANEAVSNDVEPILADIRFKRRSRVIGLGFNIGSCFFGIPIAGVPVEERSVGISVVVCKQGSG